MRFRKDENSLLLEEFERLELLKQLKKSKRSNFFHFYLFIFHLKKAIKPVIYSNGWNS